MFNMHIEELTLADNVILNDLNRLLKQLSDDISLLSIAKLHFVIEAEHIHLLVAKDNGFIIGALTLIENKLLSGNKAWIEDVVVDINRRGEGIARKLIEFSIGRAENLGVEKIDLTSRPDRIAANELYKKVGFELRNTNVYRYNLVKQKE